jgi:hypothetical protein
MNDKAGSRIPSRMLSPHGFTTVEMAISALLFLLIGASMFQFFNHSQKIFVSQNQMVAMQQNARTAMDYMTETISLAGTGLPSLALYAGAVKAPPPASLYLNPNTSAFSDFGSTIDVPVGPVAPNDIILKGNFSKIYGSVTDSHGVAFPPGSATVCSFNTPFSPTFPVESMPPNSSFSVGDKVAVYDFNPASNPSFYWAYGTVTSGGSSSVTLSVNDCTPPGGGYTFGQGALVYRIDTREFKLNGNLLQVSENGQPFETLADHVSALNFSFFHGPILIGDCGSMFHRSQIDRIQIQITAQTVDRDYQVDKVAANRNYLQVTFTSSASPRNLTY